MWVNIIRGFEKLFSRQTCCLIISNGVFMVAVEITERIHVEEEQSSVLWLWCKTVVRFFSLYFWISLYWLVATKDSFDALCKHRFNPRLQKFAITKVNHLLPWINISSDKLKLPFSGVHATPSHKWELLSLLLLSLLWGICFASNCCIQILSVQKNFSGLQDSTSKTSEALLVHTLGISFFLMQCISSKAVLGLRWVVLGAA